MNSMNYESTSTLESSVVPGVRYTITRMSFGRRTDLMRRVRELSAQLEFENSGTQVVDRLQASLTGAAIDELYLKWGLISISGLNLDGRPAEPETLIVCGPEQLCREIIQAIKRECSLNEEERKN